MSTLKVIISGGGTGGHIFPAISIAETIKNRFPDSEILFVGAEGRMEMTRVPEAGFDIIGLPVVGLNRNNIWKNFKVLWQLQVSMRKAKKIVKEFQPHVAIGVGGYASGPLMQVASSQKIPILIQEQNSYPGVTNKLLAKRASVICVAYPNMDKYFPKDKIVLTGNPCRNSLTNSTATREEAAAHFDLDPSKKTILVIGGSLGSRTINKAFQQKVSLVGQSNIQLIWQSGDFYFHELFLEIPNRPYTHGVRLYTFIDRMDLAYKMADLVVSRSGAGSISEMSLLGKPTVLVPSPNVAEDHQTKNAEALVKNNATVLITDENAANTLVEESIKVVLDDKKLASLSENITKMAELDSANKIVDEMVKIIKEKIR